ncbi:MAG: hypothetical protein K2I17_01355 [Clostridia bacterium]|nr:hypothetical protein [Clostridia bacterium]MDE5789309.1 hypothetical protein [Clostridia bacterium]MDE6790649.1 hypothetical protein [Clostridia bacterium]MDE7401344.1 hypothetical protein [Clostridia bacterium]
MDDIKAIAKQAKRRLGTDFWRRCKEDVDTTAREAEKNGKNAGKVKSHLYDKVKSVIRGEAEDEFYLKVKKLLDEYGETSDAIGRLTDREYFNTLSYEERQRYTMELSSKYLAALEKYRKEKESAL